MTTDWLPVDLGAGVRAAFTLRGFDLSQEAGRRALSDAWGGPLAFAIQVHGDRLVWVGGAAAAGDWAEADALATDADGIGLVVRTADCVPVLLADPVARLVAAVHSGWRGLLAGVVPGAVRRLRSRGASDLRAAVGPAICGECYEVGADLAARAAAAGHVTGIGADGGPRLDVPGSVRRQLAASGVPVVADSRECTAESDRLFSWRARRDGGRQGGLISLVS
jgi:YfiH family protein